MTLAPRIDDAASTARTLDGGGRARQPVRLAALRAPLAFKIIAAHVGVIALAAVAITLRGTPLSAGMVALAIGAAVVDAIAVMVALRPVHELESVARRVWIGDYAARVEGSIVADHDVLRVGSMFNLLLDGLAADRARMRELARDVIEAGDRERSALARVLRDSTAQRVAALQFELSTAAREANDPALAKRLESARDAVENILEEVRQLSHNVHSAVLDDLGLPAALRRLAREAGNGTSIDFDVDADIGDERLPADVEAALYRVAQEAVENARRHASARRVQIRLRREQPRVEMRVRDDGKGFVVENGEQVAGKGLTSMRERMALIEGSLHVESGRDRGTTITAVVPARGPARP